MTDLRIFLASVHVEIDAALARLATVDTDMLPPDLRIRYDDGSDAVERDASGCGIRLVVPHEAACLEASRELTTAEARALLVRQ